MDQKNSESLIKYDEADDEWKVACCSSPDTDFTSVSMVNGKLYIGTQEDGTFTSASLDKPHALALIEKMQELVNEMEG